MSSLSLDARWLDAAPCMYISDVVTWITADPGGAHCLMMRNGTAPLQALIKLPKTWEITTDDQETGTGFLARVAGMLNIV